MADDNQPQWYLLTPPEIELSRFPDMLARLLDATEIACLRLDLATRDEDRLSRAADALREVAHARDVAIVISDHVALSQRLGLDGVHLRDPRGARKARADLGGDAILGAHCAQSRHDGMTAGEVGADYVSFGPVGETSLGDGETAPRDLFEWWSQMIEVPVVAEGAIDAGIIRDYAPVVDFFAVGEEIWRAPDPLLALQALKGAVSG